MTAIREEHKQKVQGGNTHITFEGLLALAHEKWGDDGFSLEAKVHQVPSPENGERAVVEAKLRCPVGDFGDVGDADPANVNKGIKPHILRMASTRAKARCLRDGLNIGEVAYEEMLDGEPSQGRSSGRQNGTPMKTPSRASERGTGPSSQRSGETEGNSQSKPATKSQKLRLAHLMGELEKTVDAFEEHLGYPMDQIDEFECKKWIKRFELQKAKKEDAETSVNRVSEDG